MSIWVHGYLFYTLGIIWFFSLFFSPSLSFFFMREREKAREKSFVLFEMKEVFLWQGLTVLQSCPTSQLGPQPCAADTQLCSVALVVPAFTTGSSLSWRLFLLPHSLQYALFCSATSLLSGTTKRSRIIVYISCTSPRISFFSQGPGSFYWYWRPSSF